MIEVLKPLSQISDSRRTLSHLLTDTIRDINHYEAKKGAVLGNHYHKKTDEYFYITRGSCLVRAGKSDKVFNRGAMFVIRPQIMHSIECLTDLEFLTFLTEPFDEHNPDLHKV